MAIFDGDDFAEVEGPMNAGQSSLITKREESSIEKLERQSIDLQDKLNKVNRLKQLLTDNPQFEELLNLTREVRLR